MDRGTLIRSLHVAAGLLATASVFAQAETDIERLDPEPWGRGVLVGQEAGPADLWHFVFCIPGSSSVFGRAEIIP